MSGRSARGLGWIAGFVALIALAAIGIGAVLAVVAAIVRGDDTPALSLEVGQCLDFELPATDPDISSVPVVDCAEPHTAEVFHVGVLDPDGDRAYPPDDETLFRVVVSSCVQSPGGGRPGPFEEFVGIPFANTELLVFPIAPDADAWGPTNGRYICLLVEPDGALRTGTLRDAGR